MCKSIRNFRNVQEHEVESRFIRSKSIYFLTIKLDVLVMPLHHVSRLSSLNSEELFDIFSVVEKVQNAFEVCYGVSANTVYLKDECNVS
jgi:hypothetical protein